MVALSIYFWKVVGSIRPIDRAGIILPRIIFIFPLLLSRLLASIRFKRRNGRKLICIGGKGFRFSTPRHEALAPRKQLPRIDQSIRWSIHPSGRGGRVAQLFNDWPQRTDGRLVSKPIRSLTPFPSPPAPPNFPFCIRMGSIIPAGWRMKEVSHLNAT